MTKETLVTEAEALADSTDWGPTTGAYRDLMARWKAAGPAPRDVEESLWKRFREAQDQFFAAKQAALSEQDTEFRVNAEAKEKLLAEAEALLPIGDPALPGPRTGTFWRRWSAIGKVPRDAIRPLDTRLRAVETAIKAAEEERWRRSNPEAKAGPRTPPPSWRRRSPPWKRGPRKPRSAATMGRTGGDGVGCDLPGMARAGPTNSE